MCDDHLTLRSPVDFGCKLLNLLDCRGLGSREFLADFAFCVRAKLAKQAAAADAVNTDLRLVRGCFTVVAVCVQHLERRGRLSTKLWRASEEGGSHIGSSWASDIYQLRLQYDVDYAGKVCSVARS